jgi:hypothetical protein
MRKINQIAVAGVVAAVASFAGSQKAQALNGNLTAKIAPASGVDLSNLVVGETFDVNLILQSTDPYEAVTRIYGTVDGSYGNLTLDSLTQNPALFSSFLTTPLVAETAQFTVNSPGTGSFFGDFDQMGSGGKYIETNERSSYFLDTNTLSYSATASAVPEPASAGLIAAGAVGLLGRRRRRQAAKSA